MSPLLVAKDKQRTRRSGAAALVGVGGRFQEKTKDWQVRRKEIPAPKSWSTLTVAQQESHHLPGQTITPGTLMQLLNKHLKIITSLGKVQRSKDLTNSQEASPGAIFLTLSSY